MPKRMNTNNRNTTTLASSGREENKDLTSLRIDGMALTLFKGRSTRRVLRARKLGMPGIASTILNEQYLPNDHYYKINPVPRVS
jgi:hypothetical protein